MKHSINAKYEKIPNLHSDKHLEAEALTRTSDLVRNIVFSHNSYTKFFPGYLFVFNDSFSYRHVIFPNCILQHSFYYLLRSI